MADANGPKYLSPMIDSMQEIDRLPDGRALRSYENPNIILTSLHGPHRPQRRLARDGRHEHAAGDGGKGAVT